MIKYADLHFFTTIRQNNPTPNHYLRERKVVNHFILTILL